MDNTFFLKRSPEESMKKTRNSTDTACVAAMPSPLPLFHTTSKKDTWDVAEGGGGAAGGAVVLPVCATFSSSTAAFFTSFSGPGFTYFCSERERVLAASGASCHSRCTSSAHAHAASPKSPTMEST